MLPVLATGLLLAALVINTIVSSQLRYPWEDVTALDDEWIVDREASLARAHRLAQSLTIATVSWDTNRQEYSEFVRLRAFLKESKYTVKNIYLEIAIVTSLKKTVRQ